MLSSTRHTGRSPRNNSDRRVNTACSPYAHVVIIMSISLLLFCFVLFVLVLVLISPLIPRAPYHQNTLGNHGR